MKINLPEGFLDEEVRCDYLISAHMKSVWALELEVYKVFDEVCKKHDIKYYWAYGNLLGAVRHEGYIPWDDDIDVFVSRKDYEKLCSIASEEFTYPYFFQNDHTDPGSHIAFAKLRRSDTSAIIEFERPYKYKYNQGMFLDIFPLDNVPDDEEELAQFAKKISRLKSLTGKWARYFDSTKYYFGRKWVYVTVPFIAALKFFVHLFKIPNIPCRMLEKTMQRYNGIETKNFAMMGLGDTKPYPKRCFENTVMLPYEFMEVPCPEGYEEILDIEYGNWHVFVRGAAGGSLHEGVVFDTERSYKEYLK